MLVSNNIVDQIVPDIKVEMLVDQNLFVWVQSLLHNFENHLATHGVGVMGFGITDWEIGFYGR